MTRIPVHRKALAEESFHAVLVEYIKTHPPASEGRYCLSILFKYDPFSPWPWLEGPRLTKVEAENE